jgi:RND family efflux transporter MFP subunit
MKGYVIRGGLIVTLVLAAGCPQKNEFVAPPPPTVTVAQPAQRDVTVYVGFPGRTDASDTVDINARVRGYLRTVDFMDGGVVYEGQQLFTIEQEPYEAALSAANANREQAVAAKGLAEATYERNRRAYSKRAVSEIDVIAAQAEMKAAVAAVFVADAAIEQAQLDLDYTTITAPVRGRIARHYESVGNLVGGSSETLLTTIVVDHPLHVYFSVDERMALTFLTEGRTNKLPGADAPPIQIELADGSRYEEVGRIDYADPDFDPETGTLALRGVFNNNQGKLLPGMFVRVLIPEVYEQAILVPDLCIQRDIAGPFVLVVNAEGEVARKEVTPGARVDAERIIAGGLTGLEQVIVGGLQRARPGIKVETVTLEEAASEQEAEGA